MSNDVNALVASADRRRRIAIAIFVIAVGIAALFPRNDRAMWVPEDTPFVFTAVPEKLPVVYLSIDAADALLHRFVGLGRGGPKNRSRFAPLDPAEIDPILGPTRAARGNIPEAAVPQFGELPVELADAGSVPGGPLDPGTGTPIGSGPTPGGPSTGIPGGGPGGGGPGGGPGTLTPVDPDPTDPTDPTDPVPDVPPVMSPVPEPMTWAMFILGFGLIGLVMRVRRRRRITA